MKALPLLLLMLVSPIFSEVHHHYVKNEDLSKDTFLWEKQNISSFEELLISWNATRPQEGHYSIYVSVHTQEWSPWLLYADWGKDFQKGFISKDRNFPARVFQDAVEILEEKTGNGFRLKIVAENGADISRLKAVHVCSSNPSSISLVSTDLPNKASYLLDVQGLSQMALKDERANRLCSPTSTTAVVRFLKKDNSLNPITFAESVWDSSFDIFGNWVFNVAEAYHQIDNPRHSCWVERLESFEGVLDHLQEGFPVIISIRGPLSGSAQPYKSGHLLAIIGFDSETNEVICMDPAFNEDSQTRVRYHLDDLVTAWSRRKNVAYVFQNSQIADFIPVSHQ